MINVILSKIASLNSEIHYHREQLRKAEQEKTRLEREYWDLVTKHTPYPADEEGSR